MSVLPYANHKGTKKIQVAEMFDNISGKYDFLNRLLSFGIDRMWRKKAVSYIRDKKGGLILDIATGTGDFAIEALGIHPEKVIGVDVSSGMLAHGKRKLIKKRLDNKIELQLGDSEGLGFKDCSFDAAIVAFGVRNFENLEKGLNDMYRVIKPGGKVVVLEFSRPTSTPFKQFYNFYFKYILPTVGRLISKDKNAYTYLPESVNEFPNGEQFLGILNNIGFINTQCKKLTFGISSIYVGHK